MTRYNLTDQTEEVILTNNQIDGHYISDIFVTDQKVIYFSRTKNNNRNEMDFYEQKADSKTAKKVVTVVSGRDGYVKVGSYFFVDSNDISLIRYSLTTNKAEVFYPDKLLWCPADS